MKKIHYSACCCAEVVRNTDRRDLIVKYGIPCTGYHCSRCRSPVTVYGNPYIKEKVRK